MINSALLWSIFGLAVALERGNSEQASYFKAIIEENI